MNIAFLINSLGYGGAERVFVDDANSLAQRGEAVTLFLLYGNPGKYPLVRELDARVQVVPLRARSPFDRRALLRYVSQLRERNIVAVLSTLNDANLFARFALFSRDARTVRLVIREANTVNRKTWWQKILDVVLSPLPYRTIAVSEEVRRSLLAIVPWMNARVIVLPNAAPDIPEAKRRVRQAGEPFRILTVGRLTAQKDHHTFIAALAELASAHCDFHATIVGDGPLREALERQAESSGLADRITFTGAIPHDAVFDELAHADLFVLPSRWEGSPNVLLEAKAFGVAVVATRVGGVPEMIEEEKTGLLVEPGNSAELARAIERLLVDPALHARLGSAAGHGADSEERFENLRQLLGTNVPAP